MLTSSYDRLTQNIAPSTALTEYNKVIIIKPNTKHPSFLTISYSSITFNQPQQLRQ